MKDLKYLLAYTIPLSALVAMQLKGGFSYTTVLYAFGFIPCVEFFTKPDNSTFSEAEKSNRAMARFFDWLLYLNVPIVFSMATYGFWFLTTEPLSLFEQIGLVLSLGIVLGTNGINVAHELGHRQSRLERFLGKLLLMPSLYMHFYIEHNFGHHRHVGTPKDPATARKNQTVYGFWITSIAGQIRSAFQIQNQLLSQKKKSGFSIYNDLMWYFIIQSAYLVCVYYFFGVPGLLFALGIALVSILLLETINYIEHYGLQRQQKDARYERVSPAHSWNSNHVIGRLVLYELTRHSDHHHRAAKKYQVLESIPESPQLPFGYTTSMVIALFPFFWFPLMNTTLENYLCLKSQ